MWKWFKMHLGKFAQGVKNIFRKKKPQYEIAEGKWTISGNPINVKFSTLESASDDSLIGQPLAFLGDGELFIDGVSVGKVLGVEKIDLQPEFFESTNAPTQLTNDLTWEKDLLLEDKLLEKIFSRSRTDLPKLIFVPTLLVSCYANWAYDSIGVDLSQLNEKGIAHYWCTSTKSMEEHGAEPGDEDPITTIIEDAVLIEIDGCWFWDA